MSDTTVDVTDLCDQREQADGVTWVCTEPLGHDDGGWHYDPVEGRWWKRYLAAGLVRGVRTVPDPGHRPEGTPCARGRDGRG